MTRLKIDKCKGPDVRKDGLNSGFTIIEMVVTTAILMLIFGVVFSSYHTLRKTSKKQDELSEAGNSARIALDALSRSMRWAGSGLTSGSITASSIGGGVNGATDTVTIIHGGSDTVTCVGIFEAEEGKLGATATSGNSDFSLQNSTQAGAFNTTTKRYVSIGGQDAYAATGIAGATISIGTVTLQRSYADATPVYLVKAVRYLITYDVDANGNRVPVLKVDENTGAGAQPLVEYIKDIQFQLVQGNKVGSITVVAVARTLNKGTVTLHSLVRIRNR